MTSPTTTMAHRILIVNCYPQASREGSSTVRTSATPTTCSATSWHVRRPTRPPRSSTSPTPASRCPTERRSTTSTASSRTGSDLRLGDTDDPRVARQRTFARQLLDAGTACWGSCWGIQLASVVAGGEVGVNPRGREWGIARDIALTDYAATSPMHEGKPAKFDAFVVHLDEVTALPGDVRLLATNDHTPVQAAVIGSFWATQYHPEYNLLEMGRLIAARAAALVKEGFFEERGGRRSLRRCHEGARHRPRLRRAACRARRRRRHHRPRPSRGRAAQLAEVRRLAGRLGPRPRISGAVGPRRPRGGRPHARR